MRLAAILLALLLLQPGPSAAATLPVRVVVLGIAQDGGVPHAGCTRRCCTTGDRVLVSSLAVVDEASRRWWLFDASPDLALQLQRMRAEAPACSLAGILLTHAHIGHYAGLMHLGREVMGAKGMPVHAMPRMRGYLASNGPWSQLVSLGNIVLQPLAADSTLVLSERVRVTPFRVPHRDEFSETVGFRIEGPSKSAVYLPDIDKWERWDRPIEDLVRTSDVAYLDGTFFDGTELPGRDRREIPHPTITESLARFHTFTRDLRARVRFIHLNHTNPALDSHSAAGRRITAEGVSVAREGERFGL